MFQPTLSNDGRLNFHSDPFCVWSVSECSSWVTWSEDSNASVSSTQTARFCAIVYSHYRVRRSQLKRRLKPTVPPHQKKSAAMGNILSLWISCWNCTSTINQILNLRLLDSSLVATSHIASSAFLLPPPLTQEAHSVLENNDLASVSHTSVTS